LCFLSRVREPRKGMFGASSSISTIFEDTSKLPFDVTLFLLSRQHCSDDKDKVYSLLSLASPSFRERIPIDYAASVAKVYRTVFIHTCTFYRRVDLLKKCCSSSRNVGGPSWVPDLSTVPIVMLYYSFCSGMSACDMITPTPGTLQLTGKICCTISKTNPGSPPYSDSLSNILQQWVPYENLEGFYPTGETRWEAFMATLNGTFFRERRPDETHPTFRTFTRLISRMMDFPQESEELASQELHFTVTHWRDQKVFHTNSGHFGRGPVTMQEGQDSGIPTKYDYADSTSQATSYAPS
jgi:hypothetical protein